MSDGITDARRGYHSRDEIREYTLPELDKKLEFYYKQTELVERLITAWKLNGSLRERTPEVNRCIEALIELKK